jgi:hypothetical protein
VSAVPPQVYEATVVVPAYNEEAAIEAVLDDLEQHLGPTYEIVVVDDGSTDRTRELAEAHHCRVISHHHNAGKGAAMKTGAEAASSDVLVFIDADATYPVEAIPEMVVAMGDHDLVRATRSHTSEHIPTVNRLGNRAFDRLLNAFHDLEGSDHMSGLYSIRRSSFLGLDVRSDGFDVEVELAVHARHTGMRVATVPIDYQPRLGEKKLKPVRDGFRILVRMLGMVVLYRPVATFVVPGLILLVTSLTTAIVLSGGPLVVGQLGLTTNTLIVALLGVISANQLIMLGIGASHYRIEMGAPASSWMLKLGQRDVRLGFAFAGMFLTFLGAVWLLVIIIGWLASGHGRFANTQHLVEAAAMGATGLQLLSFGLFLSVFHIRRTHTRLVL